MPNTDSYLGLLFTEFVLYSLGLLLLPVGLVSSRDMNPFFTELSLTAEFDLARTFLFVLLRLLLGGMIRELGNIDRHVLYREEKNWRERRKEEEKEVKERSLFLIFDF